MGTADGIERDVLIPVERSEEAPPLELEGSLALPPGAEAIVLFAHGSGSSRHSPRNRFVAQVIRDAGLGTLLFDLLTPEEEGRDAYGGQLRFDVELLAERLSGATNWVRAQEAYSGLRVGYFGASTGGGAALVAAARDPEGVGAVVSRGGRPDLAERWLEQVRTPTLLIVGGADGVVLGLNREAMETMSAEVRLSIVPGATHLFEEPGALEQVARLASDWFRGHLAT